MPPSCGDKAHSSLYSLHSDPATPTADVFGPNGPSSATDPRVAMVPVSCGQSAPGCLEPAEDNGSKCRRRTRLVKTRWPGNALAKPGCRGACGRRAHLGTFEAGAQASRAGLLKRRESRSSGGRGGHRRSGAPPGSCVIAVKRWFPGSGIRMRTRIAGNGCSSTHDPAAPDVRGSG
jgi:hypothetical protein